MNIFPYLLRQLFYMGCSRNYHPIYIQFATSPKITKHPSFRSCWAAVKMSSKVLSIQQHGHQHWQHKHWRGTWVYAKISFSTKKSNTRTERSEINPVPVFPLTSLTVGKTLVWILVKSGLQCPTSCVIKKHRPCWNALLITQPCKNY